MIERIFMVKGVTNLKSVKYDWSTSDNIRKIEIIGTDIIQDNFCLLFITRNTAEDCNSELAGQLNDGIFENRHYEQVDEIILTEEEVNIIQDYNPYTV